MHKARTLSVLFVFLCAAIFIGCSTFKRVPMHSDAPGKIKSTELVIGLNQQEIYAEIDPSQASSATGGGLLGALIDVAVNKSRSKNAEKLVTPIRDSLIDYDFGSALQRTLSTELKNLSWLNMQSIKRDLSYDGKKTEKVIKESSANAVLILNTRYYFSHDLRSFKISSVVTAYPNNEELNTIAKQANPQQDPSILYLNQLTFSCTLPEVYSEAEMLSKAWSAKQGQLIRKVMSKGVEEMSRLIAMDLEVARARYKDKSLQHAEGEKVKYDGQSGVLVTETDSTVVLRLDNGALYSVLKI